MDINQIKSNLTRLFDEGNQIVFWQDTDQEFVGLLQEIVLEEVTTIRLDQVPAMAVKTRLELEAPNERYLLYQPGPRPEAEKDWFLDVRLYATAFTADRAGMYLRELGLRQQNLRVHLTKRATFLANQEYLTQLKPFIQPDDNADDIDQAITAVLTQADQADFFNIVIALLQSLDAQKLDTAPTSWTELQHYGLAQPFWRRVEDRFGYQEEKPSLRNLLIRLMVSDFGKSLRGTLPDTLSHLMLPDKGASNAVVCLSQWRDSTSRTLRFEALSIAVAQTIHLENCLNHLVIEDLVMVKTFLNVEIYLACHLRDRILETSNNINLEEIRTVITGRLDGYWATNQLTTTKYAPRHALHQIYHGLLYAAELFDLRTRLSHEGLNHSDPEHFYQAYNQELYRVDQRYRLFCEAAANAEKSNLELLKPLRSAVEACYSNWFIHTLGLNWGAMAEKLIQNNWRLSDTYNQQHFFQRQVQKFLYNTRVQQVFIIISDAFRYEAAQELTDQLNSTYRLTAELKSQLGVLPSCTALAMAALLPHKRLDYHDNGTVLVDGQSSMGLEQRQKILQSVQGVAIKANDLLKMKKAEARKHLKSYRVVTIYHDHIDVTGDHQTSENNTFTAVRETINTLSLLVSRIVNNMSGTHILITADHGFLFQMSSPGITDKNVLVTEPNGTVLSKKRYLLGRDLPPDSMVIKGSTHNTAGTKESLDFWIPKGANRFHFVGGSRFVHGGAMLQEIVIPIIKVEQVKGKSLEATRIRSVGITILGTLFKITTNHHRFTLIQNEAISDRVKANRVRVAIYEGETPITNVESMTFDSVSKDMNEWRKDVCLTLASRAFHKKNQYQLIVRTADTGVEELKIDVKIDLDYSNDF